MKEVLEAIHRLSGEMQEIKTILNTSSNQTGLPIQEKWIDGQEIMQGLHISKRTLQTLRDTGLLKYSKINGKLYYKVADLERMLEKNYGNSKNRHHDR